ncbi:MAG: polysaccharide deacetylase family protein [Lachnospiraceae bacterium]|nr:polysaccharide deacetylase family protein [Lachnospiraceae bacterium]
MKDKFTKTAFGILVAALCLLCTACGNKNEHTAGWTDPNITLPTASDMTEDTSAFQEAKDPPVIDSVTRQDPTNTVLMWEYEEGYTYEVYRCENEKEEYARIGSSAIGSFRDGNADVAKNYYYKIQRVRDGASIGEASKAAPTGYNAQHISRVYVIMYHHFVTDADIAEGVEFEEYSLSLEEFEQDLIWLRDNGFTTITSEDLLMYLEGKSTLPEQPIILSIDDGSWGVYKNAWPLLTKYGMKADLNVIGELIDGTWDNLHSGGTRKGEPAPYCTWEELIEMDKSEVINLCSHTYGLHKYNKNVRIGLMINEGESEEHYAKAVAADYELVESSLTGWTGEKIRTVAYPYSKRNEVTDRILLEVTGYELLMGGERARGTQANYFVDGCDFETQLRLLSRPCRMAGTPLSTYIEQCEREDAASGVNEFTNEKTQQTE